MNLDQFDFDKIAREKNTVPLNVAREYVQLEVLRMLSETSAKRNLCFKGGTALHLIYNMERFSEDLDFSLVEEANAKDILAMIHGALGDENITDTVAKRNTVLVEIKQEFRPQNFRVKIEVNTGDIVPAELKVLYSEYSISSFNLQIMRSDYLIGQKVRAFLQRGKGRDLYDLWFILRTKLPIKNKIVSELTGIAKEDVFPQLEASIRSFSEKNIYLDLNPFIKPQLRPWARKQLREDVLQLLRALI